MKNIRVAAYAWCILGVAFCGGAPGETNGGGAEAAVGKTVARADSTVPAPRYREAEPVMSMVARERPRSVAFPGASDHGLKILVDSLLGVMAVFTVIAFLGKRKPKDSEYREEHVRRRSRRAAVKSPAAAPVSRTEGESPPRSPRERAERLKARREQFAADIERLMKRV